MAKETAVKGSSLGRRLLIELLIFLSILLVLALLWHPDLLNNPLSRVDRLSKTAMVSPWHPLMWAGGIYGFSGVIRLLLALVKKLQKH